MGAIITLLTDFGTRDAYVAAMKGVILTIAPDATIVDLSHEIEPENVAEAAWLLRSAYRYYPPETVHVAVVDPGVGTARRPIAASAGGMFFVGPDNGVLSWALDAARETRIVEIAEPAYILPEVSATFHGRDVFAPAAAHLASGGPLDAFGPAIDDPVRLPWPAPSVFDDRIECEVVHVDRFGNLITSLDRDTFDRWRTSSAVRVDIADTAIDAIARTYADAPGGALAALFESTDHLEIAVHNGNAAAMLAVGRGTKVVVRRR